MKSRFLGRIKPLSPLFIGLLCGLVAVLAVYLLAAIAGPDLKGSDDIAGEAIVEIAPDVQPWFEPVWSPPSDEAEGALFAFQAAVGAGAVGCLLAMQWQRRTLH